METFEITDSIIGKSLNIKSNFTSLKLNDFKQSIFKESKN